MSYDVYLEIDTGGDEHASLTDWNFTSNVSCMWRTAGADLAEFHGRVAGDCLPVLEAAIAEMEAHPAKYEAMDSPNGWGTYGHLLPRLHVLADQFRAHPKATVRVSR